MSQKLVLVLAVAGAMALPTSAFAINQNGPAVGSPANNNQIRAGKNRGIAGAEPFHRAGRVSTGPQVGGPSPKK